MITPQAEATLSRTSIFHLVVLLLWHLGLDNPQMGPTPYGVTSVAQTLLKM